MENGEELRRQYTLSREKGLIPRKNRKPHPTYNEIVHDVRKEQGRKVLWYDMAGRLYGLLDETEGLFWAFVPKKRNRASPISEALPKIDEIITLYDYNSEAPSFTIQVLAIPEPIRYNTATVALQASKI